MTADNVRAFRLATEQPQPASVPYSIFRHVCDERDRLRDENAMLRPLLTPPHRVTPDEQERAEALLSEALQWQYGDEPAEVMVREWATAFRSVPRAVLCAYAYAYTCGVSDTLARQGQTARGWWTPGRVALLVTLLAVVAIVIAGR